MGNRGALIGASLLGVLALAAIVAVFATYTPAIVVVIVPVLGVITLSAVALWLSGRSRRAASRVAVASSTAIAVLSLPPLLFIAGVPAGERVFHLLLILLTVTAVVMARTELTRSHADASAAA
jgi:hypothetical protein